LGLTDAWLELRGYGTAAVTLQTAALVLFWAGVLLVLRSGRFSNAAKALIVVAGYLVVVVTTNLVPMLLFS
jgi:hypothetical protein